jgi:hypothetical protein
VALEWATKINAKSPTAQRMLKFAFNAVDDGLVGQQIFAGEATRLAYQTDEAVEGRDAFLEKREPDWSRFPWSFWHSVTAACRRRGPRFIPLWTPSTFPLARPSSGECCRRSKPLCAAGRRCFLYRRTRHRCATP